MLRRPGRWRGKIAGIGKRFREVAGDFGERAKFFRGHGLEQDVVAMLFDQDLGAVEPEGLREADGLTASVAKDFGSEHSYKA